MDAAPAAPMDGFTAARGQVDPSPTPDPTTAH
jgi:hypothetical protein